MSRFFEDDDLERIKIYLSHERLHTYECIAKSLKDAIELHQATMNLGVAISAVTGLIEVGLRNAVCCELDLMFGPGNWLQQAPQGLNWASQEESAIKRARKHARRAKYSKLSSKKKKDLDIVAFPDGAPAETNHKTLVRERQSTLPVSDGQLVAQLTMFFWKRLFSEQYEATLWKRGLKRVFPNKTCKRSDIAMHLETIYHIRNRLAHHEPVYGKRLDEVLHAIDFLVENIGVRKPSSEAPFAKLILPQRDILIGQVAMFRSTYDRVRR